MKSNKIGYKLFYTIITLFGFLFYSSAWAPPSGKGGGRIGRETILRRNPLENTSQPSPAEMLRHLKEPLNLRKFEPEPEPMKDFNLRHIDYFEFSDYLWLDDAKPTDKDEIDFQNFRESIRANRANKTSNYEKPDFDLAISPDGSFIYLAISKDRLGRPLYFARNFNKDNQLLLSEFTKGSYIKVGQYIDNEIKSVIKEIIDNKNEKYRLKVDQEILNYTEKISELKSLQEIDVINSKPPPSFYRARRFDINKSSNIWLARIKGCCIYSKIPPSSVIQYMDKIPFNKEDIRVLNLFESKSLISKLKEASASKIRSVIFSPTELKDSYNKKIKSIFKKNKGKSFIIIGHIEESHFVAYSKGKKGKKILSVSISELIELADRYKVNLFLLGCNTKLTMLSNNDNYIGTVSKIRAARVLDHLIHAANNANTWADFLDRFSDSDMPLAVGYDFINPSAGEKSQASAGEKSQASAGEKSQASAGEIKTKLIQGSINFVQFDNNLTSFGMFWFFYNCQTNESDECED